MKTRTKSKTKSLKKIKIDFNSTNPPWAIAKAQGYLTVGAQLPTRDGRKIGNAIVIKVNENKFALIRTDFGTTFTMSEDELKCFFYEPTYIIDINEYKETITQNVVKSWIT